MNSMLDAIKAKRMGSMAPKEEMAMEQGAPQDAGLKDLITSLSEEQKMQLMEMLVKDVKSEQKPNAVAQGAPSSEEQGRIDEMIAEQGEEPETDDEEKFADAYLEQNPASGNGKGLGDKVRAQIMSKFKSKGNV
jgi:hypothetical protein